MEDKSTKIQEGNSYVFSKRNLLLIVIFFAISFYSVYFYLKNKEVVVSNINNLENETEINRTDFGTSTPTDFPTDIPIEKGASVNQSYGLNYTDKKQLTMVFLSTKTVKENYTLYADFLKKNNWSVSNTYENERLSALYGKKDGHEINVTINDEDRVISTNKNITTNTIKSQISISLLQFATLTQQYISSDNIHNVVTPTSQNITTVNLSQEDTEKLKKFVNASGTFNLEMIQKYIPLTFTPKN